ncbi:phage baseplate assembly protein V [Variovorax sp. Sphag1AA]|uniref:phage baseplate assembly protein V n=1 Tax=Variovorax sp. Sphag1AA TaxID=2587027 RepID=UPI001614F38B|nr:phage baseplate assembly protein V [Variovorax sp. Sphag1AA]MBB3178410.1 hypothetical protein [Variovorax sp. Sphag1AA]MBO9647928.1 baseplate assembly protein [Variovorax sp.]
MNPFYGKYRGKVENNVDPMMLGRVQVSVAAVLGDGTLSWALPCSPYGGSGVGFFAVPPVGANIWVEFEGGNPEQPIWSGCFWGAGEVPAMPAVAEMKVFKTDCINLQMSDLPGVGGFILEVSPPAVAVPLKLTLDANGIKLAMAAFSIAIGNTGVSINDGALEVI